MNDTSEPYVLRLSTTLDQKKLKNLLEKWEPWSIRIDFSNGISTADCKRRVPFAGNPLQKFSIVEKHIPFRDFKGGQLLDVGCNSGYNSAYCADKYQMRPVGIDINPRHIEVSRFIADLAGIDGVFLLESAETFSDSGSFDVILHFGTLYHLRNPLLSLERAYENLKPGGYLALETQVYDHPYNKNICYFMHMQNNDPTNYWAMSTSVLDKCIHLIGFEQINELFRVAPSILEEHMSRVVYVARKPGSAIKPVTG